MNLSRPWENQLTLLLFVWIMSVAFSNGQEINIKEDLQTKFTQLKTKDGLSDNRILDVMQDRYGFMWIATAEGLNRYDGYEFIQFKNDGLDTTSISSNLITCIEEDIYGDLWIGTTFGLNKYDRTKDIFIRYFSQPKSKKGLQNNHIRALLADEKGFLWIETMEGFLHKMNLRTGEIQYYSHQKVTQGYYHYHSIYKENDSIIWVGGRNEDVHSFNINTEQFKYYWSSPSGKKTNDVSCYFKDSSGQLWVCGLDGVYKFFPEQDKFKLFLKGSAFHIVEDYRKNLWIGTGNGIYVYNLLTSEMKHMVADINNLWSISHSHINKMVIDMSGVLWVATNDGLNLYSPKRHNFTHYFHIPGQANSISGREITALAENNKGKLWVGTANNGLNLVDLEMGKVSKFKKSDSPNKGLVSNHISSLLIDDEENLWIGQWSGKGFNSYQPKSSSFQSYVIDPKTTNIDWYHQMSKNDHGDLLLAVWGGVGLYSLPSGSNKIQDLGADLKIIPNNKYITTMGFHHDSLIWLGGYSNQLFCWRKGRSEIYKYKNIYGADRPSNQQLHKMQDYHYEHFNINGFDTIYQIIELKSKSIFATEKGLFTYDYAKEQFSWLPVKSENSLSTYKMASFSQQLFVLQEQGLSIFDLDKNTWTSLLYHDHFNSQSQILVDSSHIYIANGNKLTKLNHQFEILNNEEFPSSISQLHRIPDGRIAFSFGKTIMIKHANGSSQEYFFEEAIKDFIVSEDFIYWIGEHQLWEYDIQKARNKALMMDISPNIDLSFLSFHEMRFKNDIVYLASDKGLVYYSFITEKAEFIRYGESSFLHYPVHLLTSICKGNDGDYWLGTTSTGIAKWSPDDGTIFNYASDEFDEKAFWGKDVSFIFKDSQNRIWAGGHGLHLYHEKGDYFEHFTTDDGLSTNDLKAMTEDNQGRYWITTGKGLSRFSFNERSFRNYSVADGLPDNQLTSAIIKLKNGKIAFGSKNGFAVFHPDSLQSNYYIPPVVITEMQIQDNQLFLDLSELDTLYLEPDENHLSFKFSSLDYNSPDNNRYQYQLVGVDEEWLYTDAKNRAISYSNLDAGTYVFKLKGSNNNDIWNENGKSLTVDIKPHFYEQWWFYLLVGLFLLFVIIMIVIYRVREINLRNKAAKIEQRFLRSQMNPHFIFNSLGAIQNYIFKKEPVVAATYLADFSELVRMILNNSRNDFIPLETEIKTLRQYLELQKLRFNQKFNYELIVDEKLGDSLFQIPPMLAQPFIENSIEHGFIGMQSKGLIQILFKLEDQAIKLICIDNGIGINQSQKKKKDHLSKHQSLATQITHERIKVINKVHHSQIRLIISDLSQENIDSTGTKVEIIIPLSLQKRIDHDKSNRN